MPEGRGTALIQGILAGLLFGSASIFIRFLPKLSAFEIASGRLFIACAILAVILVITRQGLHLDVLRSNVIRIAALGVLLGIHFILFAFSVRETSILNATILVNTTPILASLISALVYKVRPDRRGSLGMVLSVAGISVITYGDAIGGFNMRFAGDLMAVLAAFVEAIYLNLVVGVRKKMPALAIMAPLYLIAGVLITGVSPLFGGGWNFSTDPSSLLFLFALGALPTAVAHTLYFSSLSHLKSFETSTMALLEPIGATALGIVAFMEVPSPYFVLGGIIVLLGIFVTIRR